VLFAEYEIENHGNKLPYS